MASAKLQIHMMTHNEGGARPPQQAPAYDATDIHCSMCRVRVESLNGSGAIRIFQYLQLNKRMVALEFCSEDCMREFYGARPVTAKLPPARHLVMQLSVLAATDPIINRIVKEHGCTAESLAMMVIQMADAKDRAEAELMTIHKNGDIRVIVSNQSPGTL